MIKAPLDLKCEYLINPICIDVKKPRFSWLLEHIERNQSQSAFQLIVSTTIEFARNQKGDMWNTGKLYSTKHLNIEYDGKELESDETYYWRVKWWDNNDNESNYSEIQIFGTALFEKSDWKAKWISRKEFINKRTRRKLQYRSGKRGLVGRIRELESIYFRKEFTISKIIKSAKLYVSGIGYYHLYLNGKKVGNRILEPAQTDYKKIALYSTYNVVEFIQKHNAIGVILGNGKCIETFGYDFPKLILQLNIQYTDGSSEIIYSDDSWKVSNGPIKENGIYFGEVYDARLETPGWNRNNFNDTDWYNAVIVKGCKLASQMMQPIEISKIMEPKEIYSPKPGVYVIDFKQNFTGFVQMKVRGPRGTKIKLRFSEITFRNGEINTATNGGAPATDIYILKGEGEEFFKPHFTYHGFRYVEITGFPGVPTLDNFKGLFFHSNVPKTGEFYSSNTLINRIHSNILWGQLSNLMSIPTDCPQRDERHGWMGDAQITVEESILNFDMARFLTKYLRDIRECQKEDGSLSDVVPPYWKLYPADPAWGTAFITITWYLYWYYGDVRVLEDNYHGMKKYMDFLISESEENLFLKGKYGDWCPPCSIVSRKTPIELTSSWYFYHDAYYLAEIAEILGKTEEHEYYEKKANEIKSAFNEKFLTYCYETVKLSPADQSISQTSNVLPLALNIVPEKKKKKVLSTLINSIKDDYDYHIDTGLIGTRYIFNVLTESGHPDIAYKMITQESFPSYGYMIKEGATTLWERWEKLEGRSMNSHNHIMLGCVDTWFYQVLTGIKCLSPGWQRIMIKPFIPDDMNYAHSSIKSYNGIISSSWERMGASIKISVSIPVGMSAEIWIPLLNTNKELKENGNLIWSQNKTIEGKIQFLKKEKDYLVFQLGSGHYKFDLH